MTPYIDFLRKKIPQAECAGFEPTGQISASLFEWQRLAVLFALRRGRAALFEECGLGKTLQQLEWGQQVSEHCGGPVLIVAPLSVGGQTVAEGARFGYDVTLCRQPEDVKPGLNITNYDRLHLFENVEFAGVVLDESSILKSFDGKTRRYLTDRFAGTHYRLCCTATPAPNDFTELGQHAEFLGICKPAEMLATYFINDTFDTGTWRLKGHAVEEFWRWVSSWAVCISKPSDVGFPDEGFALPELEIIPVWVDVDETTGAAEGELIRNASLSATSMNREMRLTLSERCNRVAEIVRSEPGEKWAVWCNLNDEQDALEQCFGPKECVSVRGSDKPEHKLKREQLWREGDVPVMISKGSIFGYGMNWQHCCNLVYFPTYSYEDFHQIVRRFWRFGQQNKVKCYVVLPRTGQALLEALKRKEDQHEQMRELMTFTRENLQGNNAKGFVTMNTEVKTAGGENWVLYHGDCVRSAKHIGNNTVGFSVFSPPFADLFTYSNDVQDMGNCKGVDEFMQHFGYLVDEIGRMTMPGRECAVHCCDLLATKWKDGGIELKDFSGEIARAFRSRGWLFHSRITIWKSPVTEMQRTKAHGLLYKTLCKDSADSRVGVPDYLLVFRKRGENPKPIAHSVNTEGIPLDRWQELASPVWMTVSQTRVLNGEIAREDRDERHICPLQLDVIERALTLWSAPGDRVYSPFAGIGSEGYCAVKMGRSFVGSELKQSYFEQACANLEKANDERRDLFTLAEATA